MLNTAKTNLPLCATSSIFFFTATEESGQLGGGNYRKFIANALSFRSGVWVLISHVVHEFAQGCTIWLWVLMYRCTKKRRSLALALKLLMTDRLPCHCFRVIFASFFILPQCIASTCGSALLTPRFGLPAQHNSLSSTWAVATTTFSLLKLSVLSIGYPRFAHALCFTASFLLTTHIAGGAGV